MDARDPREIDADGFLSCCPPQGMFELRHGFGGLSSAVGTPSGQVGIVVGMDTGPAGTLRLLVVWLPDAAPDAAPTQAVRDEVFAGVESGEWLAEPIGAAGLLALDERHP